MTTLGFEEIAYHFVACGRRRFAHPRTASPLGNDSWVLEKLNQVSSAMKGAKRYGFTRTSSPLGSDTILGLGEQLHNYAC